MQHVQAQTDNGNARAIDHLDQRDHIGAAAGDLLVGANYLAATRITLIVSPESAAAPSLMNVYMSHYEQAIVLAWVRP